MEVIQKKSLNVMSSEDLMIKTGTDVSRFKCYGHAPGMFVVNQFGNPEVCKKKKTVSVNLLILSRRQSSPTCGHGRNLHIARDSTSPNT